MHDDYLYNIYEILKNLVIVASSEDYSLLVTWNRNLILSIWKEVKPGLYIEVDVRTLSKGPPESFAVAEAKGKEFLEDHIRELESEDDE